MQPFPWQFSYHLPVRHGFLLLVRYGWFYHVKIGLDLVSGHLPSLGSPTLAVPVARVRQCRHSFLLLIYFFAPFLVPYYYCFMYCNANKMETFPWCILYLKDKHWSEWFFSPCCTPWMLLLHHSLTKAVPCTIGANLSLLFCGQKLLKLLKG